MNKSLARATRPAGSLCRLVGFHSHERTLSPWTASCRTRGGPRDTRRRTCAPTWTYIDRPGWKYLTYRNGAVVCIPPSIGSVGGGWRGRRNIHSSRASVHSWTARPTDSEPFPQTRSPSSRDSHARGTRADAHSCRMHTSCRWPGRSMNWRDLDAVPEVKQRPTEVAFGIGCQVPYLPIPSHRMGAPSYGMATLDGRNVP